MATIVFAIQGTHLIMAVSINLVCNDFTKVNSDNSKGTCIRFVWTTVNKIYEHSYLSRHSTCMLHIRICVSSLFYFCDFIVDNVRALCSVSYSTIVLYSRDDHGWWVWPMKKSPSGIIHGHLIALERYKKIPNVSSG